MEYYWQVQVVGLPSRLEAEFTKYAFTHGCMGTQEELQFEQPDLHYDPVTVTDPGATIKLVAYFPLSVSEEIHFRLSQWLLEKAPLVRISWAKQMSRDWLEEWKKHFKPFKLAGLEFRPVWRKGKVGKNLILLEPGMAFGTGTHATTRFAIQMLKVLKDKRKLKKAKVVDVGAGSGILSATALRLGAETALAVDNDPNAWRESKKLFKLNKLKNAKVTEKQAGEIRGRFDIVVANIIDGVLMELKHDLVRLCKPGGHIILSGILKDGSSEFLKSFCSGAKFDLLRSRSDQNWSSFLLKYSDKTK